MTDRSAHPDAVGPTAAPAGRGLVHNRRWSRLTAAQRLELQIARDDDLHQLAEIDGEIDRLTRERLDALRRLDDARDLLWPVNPHHKGRRPPATHESPIPPAQPDARGVAGRALRALARSILRQHGPLTLRSLHTWIHHYGYEIASPWPTKRLADAMGYEVTLGRLQRVERAVYAIADDDTTTTWFRRQEPPLVDPWLDLDQPAWRGHPASASPDPPRTTPPPRCYDHRPLSAPTRTTRHSWSTTSPMGQVATSQEHAMHDPSTTPTTSRVLRRLAAVALTAGVLVGSASGVASAKEIGSGGGGGGGGSTTCNPVTSLGYKGDATTSDTALGSITINYGVKPCTSGQAVVVDVKLYETANPSVVLYDDPAAPTSGKVAIFGVRVNYSYTAKVTVYDASTGAVAGSSTIFAAAVRKTGV